MALMTGGRVILELLRAVKVRYIFGNPGTTEVPMLAFLPEYRDIAYILCVHESVAVAMADGYARATGQPGVVSLHTIPGTANAIGNLYNAWKDKTPVVMITGYKDTRILGHDAFCEAPDMLGLTRQFCKWTWQTLSPQQIPEVLMRAIKTSLARPQGPTYVLIPEDHQRAELECDIPDPGRYDAHVPLRACPRVIDKAVDMLVEAEAPVFLVGNEVGRNHATALAIELAEVLGVPVFTEDRRTLSEFCFPNDHPLYCGAFDPSADLVKRADLLLALGCQMFMEFSWQGYWLNPVTKIIHISEDPWEIAKVYPADVAAVADATSALRDLVATVKARTAEEPAKARIAARRERVIQEAEARKIRVRQQISERLAQRPITVDRLVVELEKVLDQRTTVVDEGIMSSYKLVQYGMFRHPDSYFKARGGALGWGFPAALGVKLGLPDRTVIAYLGDGCTLFALQAMWTAKRYEIPVVAVVCNNSTYIAIKAGLAAYASKLDGIPDLSPASLEPAVDWLNVAAGFGWAARRVTEPDDVRDALEWGKSVAQEGQPVLLDVVIERNTPAAPS